LERAFLDRAVGEPVTMEVRRGGQTMTMELALTESPVRPVATSAAVAGDEGRVWEVFGLNLTQEPHSTFDRRTTKYRGGMHVNSVRPNSPAAQEGILPGDVLVGMHKWETASDQDIQYIISRPNLDQLGKLKFYVLRGQSTLYGNLNVASKAAGADQATVRH